MILAPGNANLMIGVPERFLNPLGIAICREYMFQRDT